MAFRPPSFHGRLTSTPASQPLHIFNSSTIHKFCKFFTVATLWHFPPPSFTRTNPVKRFRWCCSNRPIGLSYTVPQKLKLYKNQPSLGRIKHLRGPGPSHGAGPPWARKTSSLTNMEIFLSICVQEPTQLYKNQPSCTRTNPVVQEPSQLYKNHPSCTRTNPVVLEPTQFQRSSSKRLEVIQSWKTNMN